MILSIPIFKHVYYTDELDANRHNHSGLGCIKWNHTKNIIGKSCMWGFRSLLKYENRHPRHNKQDLNQREYG